MPRVSSTTALSLLSLSEVVREKTTLLELCAFECVYVRQLEPMLRPLPLVGLLDGGHGGSCSPIEGTDFQSGFLNFKRICNLSITGCSGCIVAIFMRLWPAFTISISDHPDLLYFQCERHRSLAVIAEKDSGLLMMYVVTA